MGQPRHREKLLVLGRGMSSVGNLERSVDALSSKQTESHPNGVAMGLVFMGMLSRLKPQSAAFPPAKGTFKSSWKHLSVKQPIGEMLAFFESLPIGCCTKYALDHWFGLLHPRFASGSARGFNATGMRCRVAPGSEGRRASFGTSHLKSKLGRSKPGENMRHKFGGHCHCMPSKFPGWVDGDSPVMTGKGIHRA